VRAEKSTKQLAEFTKTTMIGGVMILLPLYLTILPLAKTLQGLLALLSPVTAQIPGYSLLRGLANRVAGTSTDKTFEVALVEIEEALVPAFIVEELDDGSYTVFVPSVPTPAAGAVYIVPRERVHRVDVPFAKGVSVISKWGTGAGELVKAMRPATLPDTA
jgi:uncharacterized membrane protein